MLSYYQTILSKVSFDKLLFRKELQKALKTLSDIEQEYLYIWCYKKFGNIYADILEECFNKVLV
ncbi:MAG: hypothetical protein SFU27_04230 [Thermonemataceae bacterium]|nr:hypothetical protein [Thermonemataceae bacterium]